MAPVSPCCPSPRSGLWSAAAFSRAILVTAQMLWNNYQSEWGPLSLYLLLQELAFKFFASFVLLFVDDAYSCNCYYSCLDVIWGVILILVPCTYCKCLVPTFYRKLVKTILEWSSKQLFLGRGSSPSSVAQDLSTAHVGDSRWNFLHTHTQNMWLVSTGSSSITQNEIAGLELLMATAQILSVRSDFHRSCFQIK